MSCADAQDNQTYDTAIQYAFRMFLMTVGVGNVAATFVASQRRPGIR